MSTLFDQFSSDVLMPQCNQELMPLPEILYGTAFISSHGRIYRLFGNEGGTFDIPPTSDADAVLNSSAFSLEEALRQIDSFASLPDPKTEGNKPPTLHVFQALNEPAAQKQRTPNIAECYQETAPSKKERRLPAAGQREEEVSRKENIQKIPLTLLKQKKVAPDHLAEPFIIPFAKPENDVVEKTELKILVEPVLPFRFLKIYRKHWFRRHQSKAPYRRRMPFIPLFTEKMGLIRKIEPISIAFCWSEQINMLHETANRQIQTLADHIVTESNQGIKVICFNSIFSGDGCSTILLCSVRALTDRGHRILLADAHHTHADLSKQLNLPQESADVMKLMEHLDLWVWQESKTAEENISILAGIIAANREKYDLILIDNGSLTESPLTALVDFWNRIESDGIILVSNIKKSAKGSIPHIAQRLRQNGVHLIGITENYVG